VIQSVERAIRVLEAFGPSEPRLSLSDLARRLDLPKSTVHNILKTLTAHGYVERVDGDRYALGTAPVTLAQAARVCVELRDRAAPLLRELADTTHETVYLTSFETDHVLYVYAIETRSRLLARSAVGDRGPMHCTSVGKAVLGALAPDAVAEIVRRRGLPRFTAHTIVDAAALAADLERTRERGYATDDQEHELGTYCLGAAILDGRGQVVGACSVSGRDPEIVGARQEELVTPLLYTAQEISRRMGHVPQRTSQVVDGVFARVAS
jgi:IclR family transcriptional regulator, acetate operon repressor